MKKLRIFIILLIVPMLLTTGCGEKIKSNNTKNEITIYKISRDLFHSFIKNPTENVFQNESIEHYTYDTNGESFITSDITRFIIEQSLLDFIGNREALKQYLLNNDVNEDIESIVVFDAPQAPITVWVKTYTDSFYITVNEEPFDESYVYRFYTCSDFYEKYKVRNASLFVKGKIVDSEYVAKLYYDNADFPLLTTLKALGATVEFESDNNVVIHINNKIYLLDIDKRILCESTNKDYNLFYKIVGGCIFIYPINNELMVDYATLRSVLPNIGEDVAITLDLENSVIYID